MRSKPRTATGAGGVASRCGAARVSVDGEAIGAQLGELRRAFERLEKKLDTFDARAEQRHLEARTNEGRVASLEATSRAHGQELARLGALPEQVAALKTAVAVRPAVAGGLGLLSAALAALGGLAK